MVQSKRNKFFDSHFHQKFSLPSDSIIYYIAMNPSTSNLYEKMIQTCKFFFSQNPILVISDLDYFGDGKWKLSSVKRLTDLSKIIFKLWIIHRLFVHPEYSGNEKGVCKNILSSVMPKLYRCDAKSVFFINHIISYHDLSHLFSFAEEIDFRNITVTEKSGTIVPLEKIVEMAVKAKWIHILSHTTHSIITSDTMKKLLIIPHFLKLEELTLHRIPETFDLETFFSYMKKNKTTKVWLEFAYPISEAYKNRLEEIIEEILATENHGYKPPLLCFIGIDEEKLFKLQEIYHSHYFA